MSKSVVERILHRRRIPVNCDVCDSPKVALQSRSLMGMQTHDKWPNVWYCSDCGAMVGCHAGTDIPFGLMADRETRDARWRAHRAFDPLWKLRVMSREEAYKWLAKVLAVPVAEAHISMLSSDQCEALITAVAKRRKVHKPERRHGLQQKLQRRH